jgi:hypothetical protein
VYERDEEMREIREIREIREMREMSDMNALRQLGVAAVAGNAVAQFGFGRDCPRTASQPQLRISRQRSLTFFVLFAEYFPRRWREVAQRGSLDIFDGDSE